MFSMEIMRVSVETFPFDAGALGHPSRRLTEPCNQQKPYPYLYLFIKMFL